MTFTVLRQKLRFIEVSQSAQVDFPEPRHMYSTTFSDTNF